MKLLKIIFIALFAALASQICFSLTKTNLNPIPPVNLQSVKTSPAYAEVLLRKTELLSDVESLLVEYTEAYPKVAELRQEISLLQRELDRLAAANAPDASRLSAALGKLMVRKCELDTDLWALQKQFNDQHPDVKRAKRKSEIFEGAINDILQGK
jgi:uncharacterized small protein (DUF1192 family)